MIVLRSPSTDNGRHPRGGGGRHLRVLLSGVAGRLQQADATLAAAAVVESEAERRVIPRKGHILPYPALAATCSSSNHISKCYIGVCLNTCSASRTCTRWRLLRRPGIGLTARSRRRSGCRPASRGRRLLLLLLRPPPHRRRRRCGPGRQNQTPERRRRHLTEGVKCFFNSF